MIKISVVVPTYKRRLLLGRCLISLIFQTLDPSLYEIIVADDESSPETQRRIKALRFFYPRHSFVYVPVKGRHGPAAARNQGWHKARGKIVAFTDDDCMAKPQWLSEGLYSFKKGVHAAWGRLLIPLRGRPTDYELNAAQLTHAPFVTANCFCLKSLLEEVGGFDERFRIAWREDSDLYFTLLERRKTIVHIPDAVIEHPVRRAKFGISLKQQRNNLYEALLFKKHPELYRRNVSFGAIWYYYAAVLAFIVWAVATVYGNAPLMVAGAAVWLGFFMAFFLKRLRGTTKHPKHILEMAVTSFFIPPLSILWRLAGAWRFKVAFL